MVQHVTCCSPPILHTSCRRRADPVHARSGCDRGFGLPPIGAAMDQSRWTMESYLSSPMVDGVMANYNKGRCDGVAIFSAGHLMEDPCCSST